MPLTDDALFGLTAAQADLREAGLRQDADDDGLRLAIDRVLGPDGLFTLTWRVLPPAVSPIEAASPPGIAAALRDASARIGVDARLLGAIAFLESRFQPNVSSNSSSARGLFQFIDSTWADLVTRFGPALDVTADERDQVRAQCLMGAKLLSLVSNGLQVKLATRPTAGQCYAGHFLGIGGATALIRSNPTKPAEDALRDFYADVGAAPSLAEKVVAANATIFRDGTMRRTAGSVLDLLDRKVEQGLQQAATLFQDLPDAAASTPATGDPAWFSVARAELARGVAEVSGAGSNPRIEEYFTWTALGREPDGVAWCGAFASFCLGITNHLTKGTGRARAADWMSFGRPLDSPRPGAIVVLTPIPGVRSGHVAFWIGQDATHLQLLGGNQGDRVSVARFSINELRGFRMPSDA